MAFCSKCGKELPADARFCFGCGAPVNNSPTASNTKSERKLGYEGQIHKCPNCGDILDAFEAKCENCGWERRDTSTTRSVLQFISDLQKIESKRMETTNEQPSMLKKLIGFDLNLGAGRKFNQQKKKEKIQLISTYIIPNTKEDILEFLQLSLSKIEGLALTHQRDEDEINAWVMKLKQCDQKAKLMLAEDKDYLNLQATHYKTYKKYKVSRMGAPTSHWFK